MKKLISTLLVLLFSQEFLSDSYEDEVRKRLGLLKNKPMVTMASDSDASESVAAGRTGEAVYNLDYRRLLLFFLQPRTQMHRNQMP